MDNARFDHLTRALGAALTRRRGLAVLGGGVIASQMVVRRAAAGSAPQAGCRPGLDYCGAGCCAPNERCRGGACVNETIAGRCLGYRVECSSNSACCGNLRCVEVRGGSICRYLTCPQR